MFSHSTTRHSSHEKRRTVPCVHIANKGVRKSSALCTRKRSLLLMGGVNGDAATENDQLTLASKASNILASAFAALDEKDKYDTVLLGLCNKIMDDGNAAASSADQIAKDAILSPSQKAYEKLKDPISLFKEMSYRKVQANGRTLIALVDAASTTQDVRAMATVLSLAIQNRSASFYGSKQASVTPMPSSEKSFVYGPRVGQLNKYSQTRAERLQKLPDIPTDDRTVEIVAALSSMGIMGTCLILQGVGNAIGWEEMTPYTNLILVGFMALIIFDNFYDSIQYIGSMIVKLNAERLPDVVQTIQLPNKDKNPFGLGTGKITGKIVRGFTRLVTVDTERECQCEAAAFFTAYSLGLPCFSFRPNALEGAMLIIESNRTDKESIDGWDSQILNPLLSESGVLKMLVWLLAPVAMEISLHPQLIVSDPREAQGLIRRLMEKAKDLGLEQEFGNILPLQNVSATDNEVKDLLKWAYAEAELLLRSNKATITALSERLIGGVATVGDCVAILEGWE